MSEEPRVINGADRRKKRLLEMLAYIVNNVGATDQEIKAFMLIRYGLKNKTAAEYIFEAHLAKLIAPDGLKWHTTKTYQQMAKYLYS
uniref:Uncharacterized protein n=1 Tax=viral metagenome TaxID=1070528 RepID=A0A6H2A5U0_9ZZZZ